MTLFVAVAFVLCFALLGAYVSRWHGGGFRKAAKVLKNIIWGLIIGSPICYLLYLSLGLGTITVWASIFVLLCAIAGKAMPTRQYMDGGNRIAKIRKANVVDFLIVPIFGPDPRLDPLFDPLTVNRRTLFWRAFAGNAITGFCGVAGAALVLGWLHIGAGLIVAAGGAGKAVAYVIGWQLSGPDNLIEWIDDEDFNAGTGMAEALNGFFSCGGLAIASLIIYESIISKT